jgi:hypothetical protein
VLIGVTLKAKSIANNERLLDFCTVSEGFIRLLP